MLKKNLEGYRKIGQNLEKGNSNDYEDGKQGFQERVIKGIVRFLEGNWGVIIIIRFLVRFVLLIGGF